LAILKPGGTKSPRSPSNAATMNWLGPTVTNPELDAYGKVTHAIALFAFGSLSSDQLPAENESNLPPPYFYTWHSSLRERSALFLWQLKIMKSLDRDNKCRDAFFKFVCDLADVPAIAMKNAANGPTLNSLVWLYVELRSEYTQMHLHRSTLFFVNDEPAFSIREEEKPAFEAMEKLGYVITAPSGYASTVKTETIRATPWWDEPGSNCADID
jgi:hypothetical protein